MKNPRVFMVQDMPRFDTKAANRYGNPIFLFNKSDAVNEISGQQAINAIGDALEKLDYDPEVDYIALTGRVAIVSYLAMVALQFTDKGVVKVLVFDARDGGSYRERVLEVA